jgi:hypothetical protein
MNQETIKGIIKELETRIGILRYQKSQRDENFSVYADNKIEYIEGLVRELTHSTIEE